MRLNPTPSTSPAFPAQVGASAPSPVVAVSVPVNVPAVAAIGIDIYRSTSDRSKYLSVGAGTDIAAMAFPADMDADLYSVTPYKEGIEIQAGKPAMGLDVEDILAQMGRQGFAAHGLRFSASLSMGVGIGRDS